MGVRVRPPHSSDSSHAAGHAAGPSGKPERMGNAQGKNAPEGGEGPPQAGSSHGGSGPTVTAPISINPPQRTSPGAPGSSVPGSPLTYGPQPLMEPFAVSHAASRNSSGQPPPQEFHGVAGWPQQGTLVPTVLICEQTRNLRARARSHRRPLPPSSADPSSAPIHLRASYAPRPYSPSRFPSGFLLRTR